ncbi:MAG: hypothetical protein EOM25_06260 [Deltaproteobacteria bacterium]|nr:hypothetical protein [Deltaproteobacteria bacterium]
MTTLKIRNWFRPPVVRLGLAIGLLLGTSSTLFYLIEIGPSQEEGFFRALWWTVVTITTVGYGDMVPNTTMGRILGILVMLCGIGLVSTLTGNLASVIIDRQKRRHKGLLKVNISGHIVIAGWSAHGLNLVRNLLAMSGQDRPDVVIVGTMTEDEREDVRNQLPPGNWLRFVHGNPSLEPVLEKANLARARLLFALADDDLPAEEVDQQNIFVILAARSMAPKLAIVSELNRASNRDHMLRAGADETIVRGEISAGIMALMDQHRSALDFLRRLMGFGGDTVPLAHRRLDPAEKEMVWADFVRLELTTRGVLPLAVCHESKAISLSDILGDGASSGLDAFIQELFTASGQDTSMLGKRGPGLRINPGPQDRLDAYDSVLFLKTGASHDS